MNIFNVQNLLRDAEILFRLNYIKNDKQSAYQNLGDEIELESAKHKL